MEYKNHTPEAQSEKHVKTAYNLALPCFTTIFPALASSLLYKLSDNSSENMFLGQQELSSENRRKAMAERDVDRTYRIPDELWEQIKPLLPPELPKPRGGRPRMDDRRAMEAILYVFRTGCKWKALPRSLGAPSTIHDRFQEWRRAGLFERMWKAGLLEYAELRALFWHGKRWNS